MASWAWKDKAPIDGTPAQMNVVIAGKDVVATDATACRVIDINPYEIKHIRKAFKKGLGRSEAQVLGEKLETMTRVFKRN
jgi:uncharacterized protein (DUF362 family)